MFIRIIIIFMVMLSNSIAEEISGIPKVVDGDTIHINNYINFHQYFQKL